jgi:hypothetical protein
VTQDPRYVERCARVNCLNVKVGKALDLSRRQRDYCRDFGTNITFLPVAATAEIVAAERAVLRNLKAYRKRSPNGGRMDWLEGLTVEQAVAAVFEALGNAGIPYERIES